MTPVTPVPFNLFLPPLPASADNAVIEAEPLKAEPPKRKRRRFQFRLRTLLIGVTLLAIPCAYIGRQASIVRAQPARRPSRGRI